ncbi:MAG: hypothetical protein WAS27_00135 [Candidatus Saccharimonadales bacterium]
MSIDIFNLPHKPTYEGSRQDRHTRGDSTERFIDGYDKGYMEAEKVRRDRRLAKVAIAEGLADFEIATSEKLESAATLDPAYDEEGRDDFPELTTRYRP